MGIQRGEGLRRQATKTLLNAIAVNGSQLEGQDDGRRMEACGGGCVHLKGSGEAARTEVGGQRNDENSRQGRGVLGLDDDRRSPTGLLVG